MEVYEMELLQSTNNTVQRLLTVVCGMNGDKGLVGVAERTEVKVEAIEKALPTFMTRKECMERAGKRDVQKDRGWSRAKDVLLGVTSVTSVTLALGKVTGWW